MSVSEIINLILAIASFICAVVSIIITVIIYKLQKRHEIELERINESRRKEEISNSAKRFIIDHGDSLEYIPLCVFANAYNHHHKYDRKIYNDFNMLSSEEQKEVLVQLKYEDEIIKGNIWIDDGIEKVKSFIDEHKLGRDMLYDGAKYFYRSLDYSDKQCADYGELAPIFQDVFNWKTLCLIGDKGLSFLQYYEAYLKRVCIDKDSIYSGKYPAPIDAIIDIKQLLTCDEDIVCFWMMVVIQITCAKIINRYQYFHKDVELNLHSSGDAYIETFEDKFLQVLMYLYDVSRLQ